MARETDPESRPISVAELLARDQEGSAPTAGGRRDGSRRDRERSISVAELTGEQPRIRGGAHSGQFPAIDRDAVREKSSEKDVARGETQSAPPFPPSEPLTPPTASTTFPRSDAPLPPPSGRRRRRDADDGLARSGTDTRWAAPSTRDFHRDAVSERLSVSDADDRPGVDDDRRPSDTADVEETGVIPRFGAQVTDDEFAHLTSEERDRAFESYRNFDDIPEPVQAPKKGRKGLGRWLPNRSSTDSVDAEPEDISPADVQGSGRVEIADDYDIREPETRYAADAAYPDTGYSNAAYSDASYSDQPWSRDAATDGDEVVNLDVAHRYPEAAPDHPEDTDSPGTDSPGTDSPDDEQRDPTPSSPSPARQWVMLGLQVLAGLAVGVGLFLGFTELWRWNVYFALVLAVMVVFGMVTVVHAVRRSQDLVSTLLALGVGLVVTLGPLAFLASGS